MAKRFVSVLVVGAGAALLSACTVGDPEPTEPEVPFVVSEHFTPSGHIGQGSVLGQKPIVMEANNSACKPRRRNARGDCYRFTFEPLEPGPDIENFGGVMWQSPPNNWGEHPGKQIQPIPWEDGIGVVLRLRAAVQPSGTGVTFQAGGLAGTDQDGNPLPYRDTFIARRGSMVSSDFAYYTMQFGHALAGQECDVPPPAPNPLPPPDRHCALSLRCRQDSATPGLGTCVEVEDPWQVMSGFSWSITLTGADRIILYLDEISWELDGDRDGVADIEQ